MPLGIASGEFFQEATGPRYEGRPSDLTRPGHERPGAREICTKMLSEGRRVISARGTSINHKIYYLVNMK
jgi:hypothetical protein